jgi:hypothetical protein
VVLVPLAVRRSDRVIVDSQSTRNDLVELLGTDAERIDVVPLGFGAARRLEPTGERELRDRLDLGERRVALSLSAKRPHKNLLALVGALARVPLERRPLLVLPGYPTAHEADVGQCSGMSLEVGALRTPPPVLESTCARIDECAACVRSGRDGAVCGRGERVCPPSHAHGQRVPRSAPHGAYPHRRP